MPARWAPAFAGPLHNRDGCAGSTPTVLRDGAARLLRMTFFLNATEGLRHPEERCRRSRKRVSKDARHFRKRPFCMRRDLRKGPAFAGEAGFFMRQILAGDY